MSSIIKPGSGILFMKVGTHAQESLADIIKRKTKEIEDAGFALWGYGGNTCHPRTMVQPFAEAHARNNEPIYLCMEEMNSKHFAEPLRAKQSSSDGIRWEDIPEQINVLGSRFALVLGELRQEEHQLDLNETSVAVGPNKGRNGSRYIQGHADKACLDVTGGTGAATSDGPRLIKVSLVAKVVPPYAVFLRAD